MSIRSILILASLAANIFLIISFSSAGRRVQEARQLSLLEDTDMNKVRELAGRVRPNAGLNPSGISQDLAMLQRIKQAVSDQVSSRRPGGPDLRCPNASRGELDQMLSQMGDYKKKVDTLMESNGREGREKEEMIRKVELEATKIKMELLTLCAR